MRSVITTCSVVMLYAKELEELANLRHFLESTQATGRSRFYIEVGNSCRPSQRSLKFLDGLERVAETQQ